MANPLVTVEITDGPVPSASSVPTPGAGAEAIFIGRTRGEQHETHGELLALDYDLHEALTRQVLSDIAVEAIDRWEALSVSIHHARGMVPVGEASVCIVVYCRHRAEAFKACEFIIDSLKARAPIFKHERWAHGTTWAQGTPPPGSGT
ncbi:MAG: molybdenum cofactor biosynthesis protein MoaE [Phycisphaerales bacterium]|nr:molybdenum cofactor biosynthesis protein MoaE [Phycisphaerales bacterium]